MKLLVTGGAGFIGTNFIKYWLKHHPEDTVVNLDKLTYAANIENLEPESHNPNYNFVLGDITDKGLVELVMTDVDKVVHFAAESHVDRSIDDSTPFITTNVLGTQVLLDAALHNKVKQFHLVSTDEVFGDLPINGVDKFTETTPYNPHSPYAASKASSDHLTRAYFATYGLPITITNCSNNYGPYQNIEKYIPTVITSFLKGEKPPIYGTGNNVRDWLYVEDHCRAIEAVLERGKIGETYLVGGMTKNVSNLEVANKIADLLDKPREFNFIKDRLGHDRRYAIDWSKINKELGWEPKFDFDIWLYKTIEWYKKYANIS